MHRFTSAWSERRNAREFEEQNEGKQPKYARRSYLSTEQGEREAGWGYNTSAIRIGCKRHNGNNTRVPAQQDESIRHILSSSRTSACVRAEM